MLRSVCNPFFLAHAFSANILLPVANEQGNFTTPSFVSFTDEERLIGEAAKNQAAMNPRNTIFDIKCVSTNILSSKELEVSNVVLGGSLGEGLTTLP